MKHVPVLILLLAALGPSVGCQADHLTSAEPTIPASKASHSTSPMWTFPGPGALIEGATATLARNDNGATLTIHTTSLTAGWACSVWAVVFEHPEHCAGSPCGPGDLGTAAVDATVFGAVGGSLISGNGTATFAGHIQAAATANDVRLGDGSLDNPTTAEIHPIIRCHGPALPGMIQEQISTFNGGCPPNTCMNVQFGTFLP